MRLPGRAAALILIVATSLCAAPEWIRFESSGFEVVTDAGEKAGRAALMFFEQFRYALGRIVGVEDMRTSQPVRVLVFRSKPPVAPALIAGRDRFLIPLGAGTAPPPALLHDLTNLLIETNTERMPARFERGLRTLFSTLQVEGTHVTLGTPPTQSERALDWALVHLLAVSPDYYGRMRVLLYNLRRGVDEDAAYRNAFGKTESQILEEAGRYFQAGNFPTTEVNAKSLSPRDFVLKKAEQASIDGSIADMSSPLPGQAEKLILTSAAPHAEAARSAKDLPTRIKEWKAAATAMPRRSEYWRGLAEAYLEQKNFPEAARAWRSAEQAAADSAERESIRQARAQIEQQRLDHEAAEKKRAADQKQQEMDRLKAKALAEVRALEERANRGQTAPKAGEQVVPWWDGPNAQHKVSGTLAQVDCLGSQARLVIRTADGKTVRLMVRDPSRVAISGAGEQTLGCGPQKGRRVVVEYSPKPDAKAGVAGDVAAIEFQ